MLRKEISPTQPTHPHDATLALIGLFQEGGSVADFQEGGADPFVGLVTNVLEFLTLGKDYVDDIDGIVDVTDGIPAAADSKALSPIRNLGKQLVMLEHLFDDFEGNINWEVDNEDDVNGTVTQSDFSRDQFSDGHSWADEEEATEGSYHNLLCHLSL